jgi:hypothetical protein
MIGLVRRCPGTVVIATAIAVVIAVGSILWAHDAYSGSLVWPGLVGNFGASLGAFLVALAWDRRARVLEEQKAHAEAEDKNQRALRDEEDRFRTEARRRLGIIEQELSVIADGVQEAKKVHDASNVILPDLPTGGWQAGAEALGGHRRGW